MAKYTDMQKINEINRLERIKQGYIHSLNNLKTDISQNKALRGYNILNFYNNMKESKFKLKKWDKQKNNIFKFKNNIIYQFSVRTETEYYNIYKNMFNNAKKININKKTLIADTYLIYYGQSHLIGLKHNINKLKKQIRRLKLNK